MPNFSCHFRKHKSVFLQILHQSSALSNITPLYFFLRDFRVIGSKFVKYLMAVFNWQVNSSSNFVSFFIVTTHSSPVNFKLINFLIWIKGSHGSPNFRLSNVLCWKFAKFLVSFLKAQVIFLSNFAWIFSAIKHNSSALF